MKTFSISFLLFLLSYTWEAKSENKLLVSDSIVCEIENKCFSNRTESNILLEKLYYLSNKRDGNIQNKVKYMYAKMIIAYAQGINASNLMLEVKTCLDTLDAQKHLYSHSLLQYTLALGYASQDNYAKSFTMALQALELFQKQKKQKHVVQNLLLLETVCGYIKNLSLTKDYFYQILKLTNPSQPEYYKAHLLYYNSLYSYKNIKESIDSLTAFLPRLENFGDKGLLAMAYANLSTFYFSDQNANGSYPYLVKLQNTTQDIENMQITCVFYQNMGLYYLSSNQFDLAENYFRKYKAIALENNNINHLFYSSYVLTLMYKQKGMIDSSYVYLQESYDMREQLINDSKIIEEYQTYISVLLESSKKDIIIKEKQMELNNRRFTFVLICALGLILLIVLSLIILYLQKRNIHQQKLLTEAQNKELEKQLQNDLQIQHFQEERIEAQNREITSISLLLSSKNNVLQQINSAAQELPKDNQAVKEIFTIIKSNLTTNQAWNDFVLHFNKVHPNFFEKLKSLNVKLSKTDFHLFAYLRIGISTKQIAQILNVTPEAIRMHRHRLKRKLQLSQDEDFNEFIRNI